MVKRDGEFFLSWPEAVQAGTETVGGKGWNLGRLERYGFSIPAGGVLSTEAYQDFIEKNGLRQTIENISQRVTVDNVGEQETEKNLALLREKIKAGRISVGYEFPPGLKIIRLYKGRPYFNLAAMQWGYFDAFGISPKALNAAWGGH